MIACATLTGKDAPAARRLSIQSWETSSIVSTNALTIKAKLVIHKAIRPTPVPIPNEENKINAHTKAGIFRKNVANPLTYFAALGKGEIFSLPKREMKNASTAAMEVAETASAMVTTTLDKIPGILLAFGRAGGKKSMVIKSQNASPFFTSSATLNLVYMVVSTNSTTITIPNIL